MSGDYWYNLRTGEVEVGKQSDWSELLGPYPTAEAAAQALETARARTQAWEDEERREHEDD
jgi:hypothetical protein